MVRNTTTTSRSRAGTLVLAVKPQIMQEVCKASRRPYRKLGRWSSYPSPPEFVRRYRPLARGGDLAYRARHAQPAGTDAAGYLGTVCERTYDGRRESSARDTNIISAVGHGRLRRSDEDIDAVTAISGTGPAYFYLLIDMMIRSAQEFGLDAQAAQILDDRNGQGCAALATPKMKPWRH